MRSARTPRAANMAVHTAFSGSLLRCAVYTFIQDPDVSVQPAHRRGDARLTGGQSGRGLARKPDQLLT